jgi:hypothetical protein
MFFIIVVFMAIFVVMIFLFDMNSLNYNNK